MAMHGTAITVVFLLAAIASPVSGTLQDGLPRPDGYPDVPTDAFGATPPCLDANGVAVTCEWYGFAHQSYQKEGKQCDVLMREVYFNATNAPVGSTEPYVYYFNMDFVFDTATNDSYCLYGCFDLSNTAAAAPPLVVSSPPPAALITPPPVAAQPPLAAPPGTSLVNLNGAGFLRPSGFLSFVVSVILLSFIGLAAF